MHKALEEKMSSFTGLAEKQGDIGLELEIEGENLPTEITGWDVHSETSLRGKGGRTVAREENHIDTPREYVTARPVLYRNLLPKLRTLNAALTARGVVVNLTPRASTHIHLNMGGETLGTFITFILTFCAVEPLLLRLCGPLRNGNLFCLPSYETGELAHTMKAIINRAVKPAKRGAKLFYSWPSRGKYTCLNLDPMATLGSVEVRCFPNSIDPEQIASWARWLVTIRDQSRTLDIGTALTSWYDRPMTLSDAVFGWGQRLSLESECSPQTPAQLIQYGIENAYEIWRSVQPLYSGTEIEDGADIDVVGEEAMPPPTLTFSEPRGIPRPPVSDWAITAEDEI